MCDPITMAATSAAMSYAGGAMAASSYAAVSSVGVAMVNTATLFNYSSTYGKLAGGLAATAAGYGTAAASAVGSYVSGVGVMNAVGTGLNIMSTAASTNAEIRAAEYQKQQAELKAQDAKRRADDDALAYKLKNNQAKEAYIDSLAEFDATVSSTGIDSSSMSYEAISIASKKNYANDAAAIRGMGLNTVLNSIFTSQDQMIAAKSFEDKKFSIKTKGIATGFEQVNNLSKEMGKYAVPDLGEIFK